MTLVALLVSFSLVAQEEGEKPKFKITGEFRTIGEYRDGLVKPLLEDATPGTVIRSRARINFGYQHKKLETYLTLQDARAWGQQWNLKEPYTVPAHVHEAWARYSFTENLALKIGRQELAYGEGRLLWNRNWRDQAHSHDAAVLQYTKADKMYLHLGFSKSTNSGTTPWLGVPYTSTTSPTHHKHMAFLMYSNKLTENLTLEMADLYLTYQMASAPEDVFGYNTIGATLKYDSDGLYGKLEGYFQHANWGDDESDKHRSWMYTAQLGYKLNGHKFHFGYDYYRGQDPESEMSTVFQSPYYAAHMLLGWMDQFFPVPPSQGIHDIYLKANFQLNKKVNLEVVPHMFSFGTDITGVDSRSAGFETDFFLYYRFNKGMMFRAGYSFYLPTDASNAVKFAGNTEVETRFAQFAWVMLVFKPTFLNM